MIQKLKRLTAVIVVFALSLSLFSTNAWAAETDASIRTITGFAEFDINQNALHFSKERKPSLKKLLEQMPDTLDLYLDGSSETTSVDVSWFCVEEEYETSDYYYFQFSPKWDEQKYVLEDGLNLLTDAPYIAVFLTDDRNGVSAYSVTSNPNETTIYNFLRNTLGLNIAAACGVLANIQVESSFSPTALNGNDTGGTQSYGICQWNNGASAGNRYGALITWCNNNGYDYKSLTGQLYFMKHELESSSYYRYSTLKNSIENTADGAASAALTWAVYYEGCSSASYATRQNLAKNTYWPEYEESVPIPTGSQILSDGDYHIVTALDDSFGLNVEYNSTESGKNIQIHNSMGDDETYSVVTVTYVGNGYYKLTMRNSGKVLDVASAGTAPGTNVQQYNDNGSDAQQWVIQHAGGNDFNIISKCNGLYLDVSGGAANDYTNVQVYTGNGGNNQKWKFIAWGQPTGQTIADGRYKIASALDNTKLVDVSGAGTDNGTNVQLWTDTPGAAQIWDVKYMGNGFYMLTDVNSGRNLDVSGGNAADNTNVKIYDNNGSNAQRWIIKSAGDGYYFVISKIAGQHLDALKAASDDGTNIQVYHNYSTTNNAQKWAFIRQRENKITFDMQGGSVDGPFTTMTADHVNGGRGAGELVIYNIGNTTVNTNIYGCELAVNDTGYVSRVRRYGDETHLSVPSGGLVISGQHGWSEDVPSPYGGYLFTNQVNVGDYVGFNYETNLTAAYHDRDSYLIENKYVDTGAVYGDLPVPEKEGYYFDGWYTAAKGGTRIMRTSTYSADTLYAHWTAVGDQAPVTSMEYDGHIYEVYDYHMSWKEAKEFCEERGGHLVTITDSNENAAVTDLIKQGSSGIYYIGCTDEENEGTWKWITGESFDYNNWDPHAPEPNGGADDGIDYGNIIAVQNLPNKHVGEWADDVDKNTEPGFYSYANTGFVCEYEETEKVIASGTCGTNVKWNLTDAGSLTITGSGAMKTYTYTKEVPWYSYVSQITSVHIADGVTYISDYAFYGLTRLKTITIPDSVRSIGDYAFKNAVGLESVTLSGNLNRLGESAFFGCTALKSIELPEGLYTIWEYTFKNCTSLTNVSLPQSLIKIDEAAFYGCSALTGLDIPGNVTIVGQYAFKNCSKLKELTLSSKMTEIREAAFYGTAIETLDLPEGIKKIGPYAFKKCEKLVTLRLPDSLTQIDESAFYGSSMETLDLPEYVTKIGSYAFKGCGKLREIRFPKELLTIGDSAFYYCTSLSDITLPEKLTTIEGYAFKNCTALTSVSLPVSLKTIGDSAFYSCTGLPEITIPANVTVIGAYCFSKDSALKTIRFEGNAPSIGTAAFRSVIGNAYYPKGNTTWTDAVKQNYGGTLTWRAVD